MLVSPWTGLNIKVVERAGVKLQDLLHKSNPWDNIDCGRESCFTCDSACNDDKISPKDCHKRSVVYETWCDLCKTELMCEISPKECENDPKDGASVNLKRKRNKGNESVNDIEYYRYIGESSRSCYERGGEHQKDLEYRRPKSHLLRHAIEVHPEMDPDTIKFKMKALTFHKSAFERQIREAVMISEFAGPKLLNSKLEYNRSLLPKMSLKLGPDKSTSEDPDITKEKSVIEKIKLKYKSENKRQVGEIENIVENEINTGGMNKKMKMDNITTDIPGSDNFNITMNCCSKSTDIPVSDNFNITMNCCSKSSYSDNNISKSTCSPNNSSDTYNLCKSINPTIDDKFTHKFTLNPAEPSPNYSDCNITKHRCNKIRNENEKGRHLLSEVNTQSQVETTKDPNINIT